MERISTNLGHFVSRHYILRRNSGNVKKVREADATIAATDIRAGNGVIHVLNPCRPVFLFVCSTFIVKAAIIPDIPGIGNRFRVLLF